MLISMSIQLIQKYYTDVDKIIHYVGSRNESSLWQPKDPTICEKFNTLLFADYKEQVIDLLHSVCVVSVETMRIIREMPK
jgi:predicted helicase